MLATGVKRLSGMGGDPVVQLQTNFGGGKTHSMLALYHLFAGVPATELPGADEVLKAAGVGNAQFVESLNMAKEAGTDFSGVLCGRATWKDGMPIYAQKGLSALEDFLATEGVKNINAVNAALSGATSWAKKLGVTL